MYRVIRMQGRFLHPNLYLELEGRQTNRNKFSPFRRLGGCRSFVKKIGPAGTARAVGRSDRRNRMYDIRRFLHGSTPAGREAMKPRSISRPMASAPSPSAIVVTTTVRNPDTRKSFITSSEDFPQSGSTISIPCGESCCSRYLRTSCRKISPKMKRVTPCVLKCSTARDMATS